MPVLEMTRQALDAAEGSIFLRDSNTGDLVVATAAADDRDDLHGQRLAWGEGIAGWVAERGQAARVNDVQEDPRWYAGMDDETGFETHSLMCAPLEHQGQITGVIEVVNKRDGDFSGEDLSLLEAVSSIAAVALENARLYTTTQARAEELASLNEIGRALTSTLNYEEVVQEAISHAERLFQADGVVLLRPDSEADELRFVQALVHGEPVETSAQLPSDEGIGGWILEQREPVLIRDLGADSRLGQTHLSSQDFSQVIQVPPGLQSLVLDATLARSFLL